MSLTRAPIGEILVHHEHLQPRELERLLTEDRKHRLVSMLILRAEIEVDDGTLALSEQSGYPAALERHLEQRDASLARSFPPSLMRTLGVVPMTKTAAGALVVVARDPSPALADALRSELGMPIELAIAPAIFLERLIQRLAGGAPSALPPELPPAGRPPPSRHRKSMSELLNAQLEQAPVNVAPSMPVVELPTELIQPGRAPVGITLELDEAPSPSHRPARPTRPIPGAELQPLLDVTQAASGDQALAASMRPTRIMTTPVVPTTEERSAPHRATPNVIKRPPTPLPVAPQPVLRTFFDDPVEPVDPAQAQIRPTYPKFERPAYPPASSVFEAETARPRKPAPRPPSQPPPPPTAPPHMPRSTTDNWDDFEDSKVGMALPPPNEVVDQMSTIGITPPVEVPPAVPVDHVVERTPSPPLPALKPAMPPPIPRPGANITRDIEKALSRATADRLLMKHAATRWRSLLLVNVAADRAKGARGHGSRLQAGVEAIEVAIASSRLLQAAVDPAVALPDGNDPLFELLGAPQRPSSAPIVVDDQVVAVLAAGDGIDDANPDELKSLANALAVAYQRFPAK